MANSNTKLYIAWEMPFERRCEVVKQELVTYREEFSDRSDPHDPTHDEGMRVMIWKLKIGATREVWGSDAVDCALRALIREMKLH